MNYIFNSVTNAAIGRYLTKPGHALLLVGPAGIGKGTVARYIAGNLLDVSSEDLQNHPYVRIVRAATGKSITINQVRDIIGFLALRTTNKGGVGRVVIIDDAHTMTLQAQNALLKAVEEPPDGTVMVLTTQSERSILPTIRSRVQKLQLATPELDDIRNYFVNLGYSSSEIDKALMISGGLPGLMTTLLESDANSPLFAATTAARDILQKGMFERLIIADDIAKHHQHWLEVLFIIGQMANTALMQGRGGSDAQRRWHKILAAIHVAERNTSANGQIKLVVLNFMLSL